MIKLKTIIREPRVYADGAERRWVRGWVTVYQRTKRTMIQHWGPVLYAERKAQWNGTITRTGVQAH